MITQLASPQHTTTIENLPEDILSNIFIRLLAKQLAQMRSVSKSWNVHLSESSFVKSHLHHSIKSKDRILLVMYRWTSYFDPIPLMAHPYRSQLTDFIKMNPHRINVIGSVHGLICSLYRDVIQIWNPSLSATSTLPPYVGPCGYYISFRFGFDPSTNDYKVVKISSLKRPKSSPVKQWLEVEIYSMRKGCWKFITDRVPSHLLWISNEDFVCVDGHDGHLHWLGYIAKKRGPQTILAFDLGSETFCEIPFPDAILPNNNNNRFSTLGVLTGKLCVMSWVRGDGGVCEVWVMEEYRVAESWVKRHTFSPPGFGRGMSAGFTSNNEFIYKNTTHHPVLYDPIADEAKILEKSRPTECGGCKIMEYMDSLVWVSPSFKHHMS